jgi:hypothetical protein
MNSRRRICSFLSNAIDSSNQRRPNCQMYNNLCTVLKICFVWTGLCQHCTCSQCLQASILPMIWRIHDLLQVLCTCCVTASTLDSTRILLISVFATYLCSVNWSVMLHTVHKWIYIITSVIVCLKLATEHSISFSPHYQHFGSSTIYMKYLSVGEDRPGLCA